MATIAALKKKIAALEAQVELVQKSELHGAIEKIRKMMANFGVTVAHLSDTSTRSHVPSGRKSAKEVSTTSNAKRSKAPKYRDPVSGVTWAGVGRAPAWIANAADRDVFLIAKPEQGATSGRHAALGASGAVSLADDHAPKSRRRAPAETAGKKAAPTQAKKASAKSVPAKSPRATARKPAVKAPVKGRSRTAAAPKSKNSSHRQDAADAPKTDA